MASYETHSPISQMQARRGASRPGGQHRLAQRAAEVLQAAGEYMDDPTFHERHAERTLFDDAEQIPEPDVAWYDALMDDTRHQRRFKTPNATALTAAQERLLFRQYNFARYRLAQLRAKFDGRDLTLDQSRDVIRWHDRATALREKITRWNLALVVAMAKRVQHSDMDFVDLISEGNMALLRSIEKFRVDRGYKFSTYACRAILKAFGRQGAKHTRYRRTFGAEYDPALERSDFAERKADEHEQACLEQVRLILDDNRADLTDLEQQVLNHRFALDRDGDSAARPLTLEQVGKVVGLTKERVRQIQNKALEQIRKTLEVDFIDGPRASGL